MMQTQSENYAPFTPVRTVDMEIELSVVDLNGKPNATATGSTAMQGTDIANTIDDVSRISGKYAALGNNAWVLDGSVEFPSSTENIGYWTDEMSDSDASIESYLEYSFSVPISSVGWTIRFDRKFECLPETVSITASDENNVVLHQQTYSIDNPMFIVEQICDNYSKIRFDFSGLPFPERRIRVAEVDFGIVEMFTNDNLVRSTIKYGADIIANALPTSQMRFTIDNSEKKFNILNPSGIYRYLQDGQPVSAYIIVNGEAVDMGRWLYTEVEEEKDAVTATITANDKTYYLGMDSFTGGANQSKTLAEAVALVLDGTGMTAALDETVSGRSVNICIDSNISKRDALKLLAQAARCTVYVQRNGVLRFCESIPAYTPDSNISANELYTYNGISVSAVVHAVKLEVNNSFAGTKNTYTAGEGANVKTVKNPCVQPANGNAVAEWLLAQYNRSVQYQMEYRCDPATEVMDTVVIADRYGMNRKSTVTSLEIQYSDGLKAYISSVGGQS